MVVGLLGGIVVAQTPSDALIFKPSSKGSTLDAFGNSSLSLSRIFSARDPLSGLFARDETCEYPVPCDGDEWCCPAGSQCVSTCNPSPIRKLLTAAQCSTILDCCPDGSECRTNLPDDKKCCPDTAETCGGTMCAEAGSVCCSDFVCPEGMTCNELGGQNCCEETEIHCENACEISAIPEEVELTSAGCPEGSECGPEAGYCQSITSSMMTATQTSTMTQTSTASAATSTATDDCVPGTERRSVVDRGRFPNYCLRVCNIADRNEYPVWEITPKAGVTDQLVLSMCEGNRKIRNPPVRNSTKEVRDQRKGHGWGNTERTR